MSADNGVYIGRFKHVECSRPLVDERGAYYDIEDGYEYRVAHAQAIENCDYNSGFDSDIPKEVIDAYRVLTYGSVPIFTDKDSAYRQAQELAKLQPTEYGISEIHYDVPFPHYIADDATKIITDYDNKQDATSQIEREKEVAVKCLVTKGMFSHEYFVMVQDYPALTPVVWRGWVDRNLVRVYRGAGTTDEGYHMGVIQAHKVK